MRDTKHLGCSSPMFLNRDSVFEFWFMHYGLIVLIHGGGLELMRTRKSNNRVEDAYDNDRSQVEKRGTDFYQLERGDADFVQTM